MWGTVAAVLVSLAFVASMWCVRIDRASLAHALFAEHAAAPAGSK